MSDRALLAFVAALAVAARVGWDVPLPVFAVLLGTVAMAWSMPAGWILGGPGPRWLVGAGLAVAVVLAVSWRAHDQVGALSEGPTGAVDGRAVVRSDPARGVAGSVSADVSMRGRRYLLEASGAAGSELSIATVGTSLEVRGNVRPFTDPADWQLARHLAGRLRAEEVTWRRGPSVLWGPADRVRGLLATGSGSMDPVQRAIFEGLVLGDDRGQDELTRYRFRASGLSHLLVVSGSNVAFVLAAVRPLTVRVPLRLRWASIGLVLLLFGTVVRWEPSVLRAVAMAGAATLADRMGRRIVATRTLLVAVVVLLCLDPLLVRSVGFQLSVAATAGIALGARVIADRLPGPRLIAEPLGVVLAAQAGCVPLLVAYFGLVPASGLVTNLLAVPIAGWVMVWGVTAGLVAGLLPGWPATLLHLPTRAMVGALDRIASAGAHPSLPRWDLLGVTLVAVAVALVVSGASLRRRTAWSLAAALLVVACTWAVRPPPGGSSALGRGAELIVGGHGERILVVGGLARLGDVAEGLEQRRIRRLDAVLVTSPGPSAAGVTESLAEAWPVDTILRPPGPDPEPDSEAAGLVLAEGDLHVGAVRLRVERGSGGASTARWQVRVVTVG